MRPAKVIFLILGILLLSASGLLGFLGYRTAATSSDPSENNVWEGEAGDTPASLDLGAGEVFRYRLWVEEGGPVPQINITDANGTELFDPCSSCDNESGFMEIGSLDVDDVNATPYTIVITGPGRVYITAPFGSLGAGIAGGVLIVLAICVGLLGLPVLIVGVVMSSETNPVHVAGHSPNAPLLSR